MPKSRGSVRKGSSTNLPSVDITGNEFDQQKTRDLIVGDSAQHYEELSEFLFEIDRSTRIVE